MPKHEGNQGDERREKRVGFVAVNPVKAAQMKASSVLSVGKEQTQAWTNNMFSKQSSVLIDIKSTIFKGENIIIPPSLREEELASWA